MFNLISTSDKVVLNLSATADIEVRADFTDARLSSGEIIADSFKPGNQHAALTSTGDSDVVSAPGANICRRVTSIIARNKHATTPNTVIAKVVNATNTKELPKVTLAAGETLVINENGTWFVYDTNGAVKAGAPTMSDTVAGIAAAALQADQETGTSTTLVVTPGRQHFHPSAAKCWLKAGLTGNILASYNITSLTDTGTGVLTITIATDFSSANYAALATIEFASTTLAQSCTTDSLAAGSLVLRSVVEAGSSADPVTWSFAGFGDL